MCSEHNKKMVDNAVCFLRQADGNQISQEQLDQFVALITRQNVREDDVNTRCPQPPARRQTYQ